MSTQSYAAVIFDMDGTLLDSNAALVRTWTTWAIEESITAEAIYAAAGHGRPTAEILQDLVPADRVPHALDRVLALEVADQVGTVALPGVLDLLAGLGSRWAIATSATRAVAEARLAAAGLPRPPVLITYQDVTAGKPDPACFLLAADRLGADPGDCLVVEDAPAGLMAARAAGAGTLAVRTTHPVGPLAADRVVPDLTSVALTLDGDRVHLRVLGDRR